MSKRFELLDETIFDNQKQAEDGGRVTYWVVEYQQRQELVELLNSLSEEKEKAELKRENEALRSNVELFAHQLVDHTLYSDDFLEILKIIEGEETIEKIRERQNEIIKILGGKYE